MAVTGYGLPEGLAHKAKVRVLRKLSEYAILVEDERRRRFELAWWLVDCGNEIQCLDGEYRYESDGRALDALESSVIEMRQRHRVDDTCVRALAALGWILRRNGRDPGGTEDLEERGYQRAMAGDWVAAAERNAI